MKKIKPNTILAIGLLLFSISRITELYFDIPEPIMYIILVPAILLELWGIIGIARSPEFKNSKLRKWKMKLIGKDYE